MDDLIKISQLNDFIFCPISIYFHNLYEEQNKMMYQSTWQTKGSNAHCTVDEKTYSTKKSVITGMDVYSEKYSLTGKIDILDSGKLIERKKKVTKIFDGYIFQVYGQYFALKEMGYRVEKIAIHSIDDNKTYDIPLPENDKGMYRDFEKLIRDIREFSVDCFTQDNREKCMNCIYEPACDRSLI